MTLHIQPDPPKVPAGATVHFPIGTFDIMPTLLGFAGLPLPDTVEGYDLSPFVTGQRDDPPKGAF